MPQQEQAIEMVKGDRTISVAPDAYKEAVSKGWSRKQQPQAKPQPAGGGPGAEGQMQPIGFMGGVKAGLNPFHQTPQNMPNPGTMGPVASGAADMFNMREMMNRSQAGDKKGSMGLGVGTGLATVGPELVKGAGAGIKSLAEGARAAGETGMLSKAAEGAVNLAKGLKVNPDIARYATRYVQPLFDAIDKKFEPIHKGLEGKAIGLSQNAIRLIRRMNKSEIPAVEDIGKEFMGRTALDYREAEGLRRKLMGMAGSEAEHWSDRVTALAKDIDTELDALAKRHGLDKVRTEYRQLYGETIKLQQAIASTAKSKQSVIRGVADLAAAKFGGEEGMFGRMGAALGRESVTEVRQVLKRRAAQIASKLGVDVSMLEGGTSAGEKLGKGIERTATAHGYLDKLARLLNQGFASGPVSAPGQ